ncbi:response regulator [Oligoflexaceae bacterium]|nr:response regulator [Oligoflexaceae bacterium]
MSQDSGLPKKILVVDDDASEAQRLEKPLKSYGVEIVKATTLEQAMTAFDQAMFDVAIVELEFGPMPGLSLIQFWREHENFAKRQTGFIVISGSSRGSGDEQMLKELKDLEFLTKPFSLVQVLPYLNRALGRRQKAEIFQKFRKQIIGMTMEDGGVDKATELIKKNIPKLGQKGLGLMIEIFRQDGRHKDAMDVVDAMLSRTPGDTAALSLKGDILKDQAKHSDALSFYEKAEKLAPQNFKRLTSMADSFLQVGDIDKTMASMRPMVKLRSFDENFKFELFDQLSEHNHPKEAVELCRETTSAREVLRYYNNKGVNLSKEGLTYEAITEYKKALRYYPTYRENFRILFNIALAYVGFKNVESYAEAENYLSQCVKLAPDFEKAQKMLVNVRRALAKKAG